MAKSMPTGGSKLGLVARFVTDDSVPIADGSVVTFSTDPETVVVTETALTRDGYATAILTSPADPGTATVTATCGDATAESTINFVGAPAHVDITFSKIALAAGGSSECKVAAQVTDASGQPVCDGLTVSFETNRGTITSPSITQNGCAGSTLTSSQTAGIATITVTCGSAADTSQIGVAGIPAKVRVVANDQFIATGGSTTRISVVVTDADDTPVIDEETITLTSTAGSLDATSVTTEDGFASAILTSPGTRGPATITAPQPISTS
jgi:hypothetical protein